MARTHKAIARYTLVQARVPSPLPKAELQIHLPAMSGVLEEGIHLDAMPER